VAVSSDEKAMISRLLNIEESAISLVHNGIDISTEHFKNIISKEELLAKRNQLHLAEGDFVLLYPALFLEAKGHRNFFNALKQFPAGIHPKIKILLAGDGPLEHEIEKLVAGEPFSNQVQFLGFVEKINDLFLVADAVILPSDNEAFGYVLLEAMYYGKPIFATAVGGIQDIVEPGKNGFLYAPGNIQAMLTDINMFSLDKTKTGIKPGNAFQLLEQKFNIKLSANRIATLYKSA
jgi:glycosyltransferase involved in cell wall biosynthesis